MRIVDLSHRIVFPHWRWKPERVVTSSHADGDLFTSSRIQMPLHGFTHAFVRRDVGSLHGGRFLGKVAPGRPGLGLSVD